MIYNIKNTPLQNRARHSQFVKLGISSNGSPARCKMTTVTAFTLIEMSIVLIVIGLIVAGIVKGKGMIESGKIVAQVQQLQNYEVAYNTFQLKYDAIPGDMINASSYWPGTLNGDGNGRLTDHGDYAYVTTRENLKFFLHLSKAKMLKHDYDGTWAIGAGYPRLELDDGKGMVAGGYITNASGSSYQLSNAESSKSNKAVLYLNVSRPSTGGSNYNDVLGTMTAQQAQAIDKKLDDGVARTGRFKAHMPYGSTQGNCLDGTDGNYLLSNDQPACMGAYILDK